MELVQEMVGIQIAKEVKRASDGGRTLDPVYVENMNDFRMHFGNLHEPSRNGRVYTEEAVRNAFTSFSGADIVATFNGNVIGTLQSISYTAQRETSPVFEMGSPVAMEREMTFQARRYEGTVELENSEVNRNMLQQLFMDEMIGFSMGTVSENRAERRANQRKKKDDDCKDQYRQNMKKVLGGRKHWN